MRHFTKEEQKKYTEAVNKMFKPVKSKKEKLLAKHILELQADKGRLTDRVRELEEKLANADYQLEGRDLEIKELEAQIEKMKCCSNCKNEGDYKEPYRYGTGWCNICKRHKVAKGNFDKWEIKENAR